MHIFVLGYVTYIYTTTFFGLDEVRRKKANRSLLMGAKL